jgi:hypothetical protein
MAFFAANRVKVSTATTGTSNFVVGAATSTAFRSFASAGVPDGATVHYTAFTSTEFECGSGVYTSGTTTLSRDTIFASSNGGAKTSFSTGPTIVIAPLAADRWSCRTPFEFGAVGDGVADDGPAIAAWLDSGDADLYLPDGNFLVSYGWDYGFIPDTVRRIWGVGTITQGDDLLGDFSPTLWTRDHNEGLLIEGITVDVPWTGTTSSRGIEIEGNSSRITIRDVKIPNAGDCGIHIVSNGIEVITEIVIEDCLIENPYGTAINDSTTPGDVDTYLGDVTVRGCTIISNPTQLHHQVSLNGASKIVDNIVVGPVSIGFAISLSNPRPGSRVSNNTCYNVILDGIEVGVYGSGEEGYGCIVDNNRVFGDGASVEVGIGLSPTTGNSLHDCSLIGNHVSNVGAHGYLVGFTGTTTYCLAEGNKAYQVGSEAPGYNGLQLQNATYCTVIGGEYRSPGGTMQYGVSEFGTTDHNLIDPGTIEGAVVSEVVFLGANSYSPTYWNSASVTPLSGSGTFTNASATCRFLKKGKTVHFRVRIFITTNGTAATYIVVSLPFTPQNSPAEGLPAYGYIAGSPNLPIVGSSGGGSNLIITKYDGTYPGADGALIYASGTYEVD